MNHDQAALHADDAQYASPLRLRIQAGAPEAAAPPAAPLALDQLTIAQRTEVTFIEGNVADLPTLLKGLAGSEVHVLDAGADGLAQIASILAGRGGIDALHIISHGATAAVNFGALQLDGANLDAHRAELAAIGGAMADGGDILLYGCDVGAGSGGAAFIDRLADATGADVAASTNLTGAAGLGGDWRLETHSGGIETAAVVDPALAALYQQTLAVASAIVNFDVPGNFASNGGYTRSNDVIYNVNGLAMYQLKIDGATTGAINFNDGSVASDTYAAGETLLQLSFVAGQVFTPTSLNIASQVGGVQNLLIKGYDSVGNQVGTTYMLDTNAAASNYTTANFSGLTNIATLKITSAGSNAGKMKYLILDDFALTNIKPPAPVVTSVTSNTVDGIYTIGATISIQVAFDAAVTVGGTPQLTLATGGAGRAINYTGGGGTSILTFSYTVTAGDNTTDLDFFSNGALRLNGGSITATTGGVAATLTLPTPGSSGSLGANKSLLVDGIAPTLTITSNVSTLKAGETATITFTFSEVPAGFAWDGITGDVVVTGGTLGALSGTDLIRTATFTPAASTNSGSASISVAAGTYFDAAGNAGGAGVPPLLTFDTLTPSAPSAPTLAADSDTGTSPTDHITNDTTPTFTGTAEAGATVKLYDTNGVTVLDTATAGNGSWTLTSSTLAAGTHNVSVKATDAAGNTSAASGTLSVTIVTATPTVVITSSVGSVKAGETALITFTFSSDPGATFTWDGASGDVLVSGGNLGAISGSGLTRTAMFSPSVASNGHAASITVAGASYTDVAGNGGGAGATPTLLVDTIALAPSIAVAGGSDSGISGTDGITSDTAPTLTGTAEANATVHIYNGGVLVDTVTANGSGNWQSTLTTLAEGGYTLTARQTDTAGNISALSAGLALAIDTSVAALSAPALASASDGGALGDGITNTATPTVTGTAEANAAIALFDGAVQVGTATADGNGAWSAATSTLSEGAHTLTAVQTDRAGNVSIAGPGLTLSIDTLAPVAPGAPVLAPASDSGTPGDGVTNIAAPTLTGTALANALVRLYDSNGTTVLGTATTDGAGNWSIASAALTVGAHTLTARQFDAAGNASTAGAALALTIEAPPPPPPTPPADPVIDGVTVVSTAVVLPGGGLGTRTVIGIVSDGRDDSSGNAGVADIPLVTSGADSLLLAQIAPGYGLTVMAGGNQPAGGATLQMAQMILGAAPDHPNGDLAHLTGNGAAFLDQQADDAPLLIATVAPVTGGTTPTGALTLTGGGDAAQRTALVIDAGGLAAGGRLVLNAVDFAAVVGAANVTGNTIGQILTGDAAAQRFTIDSGSGSAVYAGGGNDTLVVNSPPTGATPAAMAAATSAATSAAKLATITNLLHGGAGADRVVFNGAMADYTVASHEGYVVVTANAQPNQHALVINAESLTFSDTTVTVQNRAVLDSIAGLYQDLLGRQADYLGIEFWATAEKNGLGLGKIALDIIGSAESQARHAMVFNGDGAHDVELLYQGIFSRASDAGGLAFWVGHMAQGMTLTEVAQNFMTSNEITLHKIGVQAWDFQMG